MPTTLYTQFGSTLQGIFVDWSVPATLTSSSTLTATTLTADIYLNLYNTKLNTYDTFDTTATTAFGASTNTFTFMPYLTFLNTDSTTITTLAFDAWVFPS
jgi:hypothetical protein